MNAGKPLRFFFSWRVTLVCLILITAMIRLSYWQWERHLYKLEYIKSLEARLSEDPIPISTVSKIKDTNWTNLEFRRVTVSGTYDYDREMVLRNRRLEGMPGVFVITPLKVDNSEETVLVSRGFVPLKLATPHERAKTKRPTHETFVGLVKNTVGGSFWGPADPPTGDGLPWVDSWLRVDIPKIQKQLPYPILPIYIELMGEPGSPDTEAKILKASSGRDEIFLPTNNMHNAVKTGFEVEEPSQYPIPVYDTVIPPQRHLGYVYEWGFMAFITFLIGVVLQLRPPKRLRYAVAV